MPVPVRPSLATGFVVRVPRVDLHPSAFTHGVGAEDIEHAVRNAVAIEQLEDDLCLISARAEMVRCSRSSPCNATPSGVTW